MKITYGQLKEMISESVHRTLNEIYSNGRDMNLEEYIDSKHQEYIQRGDPDWMWDDEGIVYAMQDYHSSMGEFSEEDWAYIKKMGLEEIAAFCEEEMGGDMVPEESDEKLDDEQIFQEIIKDMSPERILAKCRRDEERPMGVLLSYIRDMYGLPKTKGWAIAERVLDYYKIKN